MEILLFKKANSLKRVASTSKLYTVVSVKMEGSTAHLVYEVVDNCIDEAMAGFCDKILVVLEPNDIVRVEDNGRGIPVDIHPTEKISRLCLHATARPLSLKIFHSV